MELNRATLARQLLIERSHIPPAELLELLVGVQAQEAQSWYTSLWTRLADFDPEVVSQLLAERHVVRLALMRSTIHLVTAKDALRLRPLLQPAIERPMAGRGSRRALRERGFDDIVAEGRRLLEEEPRSNIDLGRRLAERWPEFSPSDLGMAVRVSVPLVQVPPRGRWRRSGAAKHAPLETWVGRPLEDGYPIEKLVRRYLGAFGPASPADAQTWSGLSKLREVFERLRPDLIVFRDDAGRELFDLPDAPRPAGDTAVPVRYLADYDDLLLGHEDRSRFLDEALRRRLLDDIGMYSYGSLLVDGFAAGIWRIERGGSTDVLVVKLVKPLSERWKREVGREGEALLGLWAGAESDRAVRMTEV